MGKVMILFLSVILVLCSCDAYKILVMFPFPTKSHTILGDGIVRHLLNAGHEVTYITAYPKNRNNTMLHEVDISEAIKDFEPMVKILNLKNLMDKTSKMDMMLYFVFLYGSKMTSRTLEYENIQKLLSDKTQHFDAVIVEWLYSDLYVALSAVYDAPMIISLSTEPHWMMTSLIDETLNPAYNSYIVKQMPPLNFVQRVKELLYTSIQTVVRNTASRYFDSRSYQKLIAPHIIARGRTPPDYIYLLYNASLVIANSHVSMGEAKSLPQNYINIGGYHIEEAIKPLPDNLKKAIENAKHGVVYFSMGSNLKSKDLPEEIKQQILNVFGQLKQTVLWKFEENLPNLPQNVHIIEWAPQQTILAHPNVVLFITHGGLLSTTEAIYAGKPIIGIPVFSDQFVNIAIAVSKGFAKKVDLSYSMANDLKTAIDDILGDPKYAAKAKELSFIHHDRPVKPGVEMVHWVEHVIKTGGAPHLRSVALMVPWYQKMYLDLALVLAVVIVSLFYVYRYLKIYYYLKKNYGKKTN